MLYPIFLFVPAVSTLASPAGSTIFRKSGGAIRDLYYSLVKPWFWQSHGWREHRRWESRLNATERLAGFLGVVFIEDLLNSFEIRQMRAHIFKHDTAKDIDRNKRKYVSDRIAENQR